jgi:hypothetical protein
MVVALRIYMVILVELIDGLGSLEVLPKQKYGRLNIDRFVIANLLALAAVCPFVGSLSDLIGRRYVALLVLMNTVQSLKHND